MNIMSDFNVKFDSKDAVPIVLANQATELLVIGILAVVALPLGLWVFSNLLGSVHGAKAKGFERVYNLCKITQLEEYGDFNGRQCKRIANSYYRVYR